MASIFTHPLIGLAGAKLLPIEKREKRFWVMSILCPLIPDWDGIGFFLGIPYEHILGHRGLTHSIIFALALAMLTVIIFFRSTHIFSKRSMLLFAYFSAITLSHGILDALTNGGHGVAFFSPIIETRYFFPFRPIEVSPMSASEFFGKRGYHVLLNEIIWIWIPLAFLVFANAKAKVFLKKRQHNL